MTTRRGDSPTLDRRISIATVKTTPFVLRYDTGTFRLGGQVLYGPGSLVLSGDRLTVGDTDADGLDFTGFVEGEGLVISGGGETLTVTVGTVSTVSSAFRAIITPEPTVDFGSEITLAFPGRVGGTTTIKKTVWASRRDLSADGLSLGGLEPTDQQNLSLSTDSVWKVRYRLDLATGGNFTDSNGQVWQIRSVGEVGRREYLDILARRVTA